MVPLFNSWVLTAIALLFAYVTGGLLLLLFVYLKGWRPISWLLDEYLTWREVDAMEMITPFKKYCREPVHKMDATICFYLWPLCLLCMTFATMVVILSFIFIFLGICLNPVFGLLFDKLPRLSRKIRNISSCLNFCVLN